MNKVNGFALLHYFLVFLNNCHARHLLDMTHLQERGIQYKLKSRSRLGEGGGAGHLLNKRRLFERGRLLQCRSFTVIHSLHKGLPVLGKEIHSEGLQEKYKNYISNHYCSVLQLTLH